MNKVSILTPIKNASNWIRDCVKSILNQGYDYWEWIVVDDHSTDESMTIVRSQNDPRIKPITNAGHGIVDALTTALDYASGAFVTRMDADDKMPANRLESMVDKLQSSPPLTVVTGMVAYFSESKVSAGYLNYEKWINQVNFNGTQWQDIYRECVVASPNWMARYSELIAVGGFHQLTYPEDYDLVFRWYQHGFSMATIPETTLWWREHPLRTSRTSKHYEQSSFFKLKIKRFVELDYNGEVVIIWGINVKSKLTTHVLDQFVINYRQFGMDNYRELEKHPKSQLLIAVFPDLNQRQKLEAYLHSINRIKGKHWWYI